MLIIVLTAAGALLLSAAIWVRYSETPALSAWLEVGGNLHPLALHLPIGIFFLSLFSAFVGPFLPQGKSYTAFLSLTLGLAALTSYVAAALGLFLYMQGGYSGPLIEYHLRWGVGFSLMCLVLYGVVRCVPERRVLLRLLMLLGAVMMTYAGHYGGTVTHGDAFAPLRAEEDVAVVEEADRILVYEDVIARIFAEKCNRCHAEDTKQKAGLKLDTYENIMAGSKNGVVVVPGSLTNSPMSEGLHLPLDDDLHMPPDGKPQLGAQSIELIDAWILAGALEQQLLVETGWDEALIAWAKGFVQTATASEAAALAQAVSSTNVTEAMVDLSGMIAQIEALAPKGITRVSQDKPLFVFSALNARASFGDEQLQLLVPMLPYLTQIDLSGTQISSNAVSLLVGAQILQRLDVSNTAVSDNALTVIAELPMLTQLNLYGTAMTPASLNTLAKLSQLEALQIGGAGYSREEFEQLKAALPSCRVVGDHLNDSSLNLPTP